MPFVTSALIYSKWGVEPLITAPKQITASISSYKAASLAIKGISKAPGTHITLISSSFTL